MAVLAPNGGVCRAGELLESRTLLSALTASLTPERDNTLYQAPSANVSNGAGQHIPVGHLTNEGIRRGLLYFDVAASQIPAGSTVIDAVLTLHASWTDGSAQSVSVHPLNTAFGEGGSNANGDERYGAAAFASDATWFLSSFEGSPWQTPGGDYSGASATTVVAGIGFYEWSGGQLLNDVQSWLDNPEFNFGWIVRGAESGLNLKGFDSSEHAMPEFHPELTIVYEAPTIPGIIEGRKWHDLNANGLREDNEPWLNGWTVELIDEHGVTLESVVTGDSDRNFDGIIDPATETGWYEFTTNPGHWSVREIQQAGWQQAAPKYTVALHVPGSDGSGILGTSVKLVHDDDSNELVFQVDVDPIGSDLTGLYLRSLVGGSTIDLIAAANSPIPADGVLRGTVQLNQLQESALVNGQLVIDAFLNGETTPTMTGTIGAGTTHAVILTNGGFVSEMDFGNYQPATIEGRKWHDRNADGLRIPNELIELSLRFHKGNDYFNAFGGREYWFINDQKQWCFLTADGVVTHWNGSPGSLAGTVVAELDPRVYYSTELLSGATVEDEPFLNGFVIELLNGTGQVVDSQATHDIDLNSDGVIDPETERGWYRFENIEPGEDYTVREIQQSGWKQSGTRTSPNGALAWSLKTDLGLSPVAEQYNNFGGMGEKWIRGDDHWYYLTPGGGFYEWDGRGITSSRPPGGTLIADLGQAFHVYPSLLFMSQSPAVAAISGQTTTRVDFGNYQPATISGRKWLDAWPDGVRIPSWLSGKNLVAGGTQHPGAPGGDEVWLQEIGSGEWFLVTSSGELLHYKPFEVSFLANIGVAAYNDPSIILNAQQLEEPWLNGWEFELLDRFGNIVATSISSDIDYSEDGAIDIETERGWYEFDDLIPGTYSVREVQQAGWIQTSPLRIEASERALELDAQLSLNTDGRFFDNFGGLNERWIQGQSNRWFYITPDGSLYRWDHNSGGHSGPLKGTHVATLNSSFFVNPRLLTEPRASRLTVNNGEKITWHDFGNHNILDGLFADLADLLN